MSDKLWNLLAPYIASEDVEYGEAEMEDLCERILPAVWSEVVQLEAEIEALKKSIDDYLDMLDRHVEELLLKDEDRKKARDALLTGGNGG